MKNSIYILDIKRTPIGRYFGMFHSKSAVDLSITLLKYFVKKYPFLSKETNGVIAGNVLSAGIGMNPARIIGAKSNITNKSYAITLNQVCGSGLAAIISAYNNILHNGDDIIIAGGMESMSNAPFLVYKNKDGAIIDTTNPTSSLHHDGLYCSLADQYMGQTAENIARKYRISRQSQDEYAYTSHLRTVHAQDHKFFDSEIIPLYVKQGSKLTKVCYDEQVRRDTSIEKLSKLKPIFSPKGTVTAGNSSSINDGASFSVIASEKIVKKYNLKPMARIIGYNYIGLDPKYMGLGSYYSIIALLKNNNFSIDRVDLFEINEAFAASSIAVNNLLKINQDKVNVTGGAIALGHPLGASGARVLTTLTHNLKRLKKKYGIASLCIGGGQGISVLIESVN